MSMILIRFPDDTAKRKALGFLIGRFSLKSWATGELIIPVVSLPALAMKRIRFIVEGPATYAQLVPMLQSRAFPAGG
jgi:hypothetical protein